jgi:hypothetical protein
MRTAEKLLIGLVAGLLGLSDPAAALEIRLGAGPVTHNAFVTQVGVVESMLPWLHVAADVLRLERSGRAHSAIQAGVEIGHADVVPDVRLRLGVSWWDRLTERLGTHCEYHIAPLVGWHAVQIGIHHWSNAGACFGSRRGTTNAGENAVILSGRWFW